MSKIMPKKMCHFCLTDTNTWVPIKYENHTVICCSGCFGRRVDVRGIYSKKNTLKQLKLPF